MTRTIDTPTTSEAQVRVERRLAGSLEHAFDAFVKRMHAWWPASHSLLDAPRDGLTIEPFAGGRWYESGADGSECDWGRVLVWEPPRRIVLSWQIGVGFQPQADPERASRVEVSFDEPEPGRTVVRLVHDQFEGHGPGWESMRDAVAGDQGWPGMLSAFAAGGGSDAGLGTFPEPETVRFERLLPGPIERVWEYLTESDQRATWLAAGAMDLRVGGRVELHFMHSELSNEREAIPEQHRDVADGAAFTGTVTACERPHLLSYTWAESWGDDSEVTFELSTIGKQVRLVLTHRRLRTRPDMISVASGWHTHLKILADQLAGRESGGYWTTHSVLEAEYETLVPDPTGR